VAEGVEQAFARCTGMDIEPTIIRTGPRKVALVIPQRRKARPPWRVAAGSMH
jgi:hypothetical protein